MKRALQSVLVVVSIVGSAAFGNLAQADQRDSIHVGDFINNSQTHTAHHNCGPFKNGFCNQENVFRPQVELNIRRLLLGNGDDDGGTSGTSGGTSGTSGGSSGTSGGSSGTSGTSGSTSGGTSGTSGGADTLSLPGGGTLLGGLGL
ncbi:hypothetical protein ACIPUC_37190 [Streptomyces sp. LARHCF249]